MVERFSGSETQAISKAQTVRSSTIEGTEFLFYWYLLVIVLEYTGVARDIPAMKALRIPTLLAWSVSGMVLMRTGLDAVMGHRQNRLLALFVAFTGLSVVYAVVQQYAIEAFRTQLDYFGLFICTVYLVDRPARIRKLAVTFSLIIVFLVARNVDTLLSTVRAGSFSASVFLGNGNDFAWGMNVLLPISLFLAVGRHGFVWRAVGAAGTLAALFAIVGTQSRGAALAIAAAGFFYWAFVVKRKSIGVVAVAAVVILVVVFAPREYFERLGSMQNYQEDNSAMTRLQVWRAAVQMAADYPLGVGAENFASAYGRFYIPEEDQMLRTWAQAKWMSAHSVYFRLLGEYGFLGVVWIMVFLYAIWRDNWTVRQRLASSAPGVLLAPEWPLFLNMSLIGYAVSGAFLGGLTYPHLHLLSGLTVSAARQSLQQNPSEAAATSLTVAPVNSRSAPLAFDVGQTRTVSAMGTQSVVERARHAMRSRRKVS